MVSSTSAHLALPRKTVTKYVTRRRLQLLGLICSVCPVITLFIEPFLQKIEVHIKLFCLAEKNWANWWYKVQELTTNKLGRVNFTYSLKFPSYNYVFLYHEVYIHKFFYFINSSHQGGSRNSVRQVHPSPEDWHSQGHRPSDQPWGWVLEQADSQIRSHWTVHQEIRERIESYSLGRNRQRHFEAG